MKWIFANKQVNSAPAIGADGTIYFGSIDFNLHAVNPDGTLKWRFATDYYVGSPAIGADGTVYFASGNGYPTATLYALH